MGDESLRELERAAAGGDPLARQRLAIAHLRHGGQAARDAEALAKRLTDELIRIHTEIRRWSRRALSLRDLLPMLRDLVVAPDQPLRHAHSELAKVWPNYREGLASRYQEPPITVLAFGVRRGDEVTVSVRLSESVRASPGTGWPELAPWRDALSQKVLDERLARWLAATAPDKLATTALALEVLIAREDPHAPPADVARPRNPATPSQLRYLRALSKELDLSEADLMALAVAARLVPEEQVQALTRPKASQLIDILVARKEERAGKAPPPAPYGTLDLLRSLRQDRRIKAGEWKALLALIAGVDDAAKLSKRMASKLIDTISSPMRMMMAQLDRDEQNAARKAARTKTVAKKAAATKKAARKKVAKKTAGTKKVARKKVAKKTAR